MVEVFFGIITRQAIRRGTLSSVKDLIAAIAQAMATLPKSLRQSLTWDQGKELSGHKEVARASELAVYFCDPRSP